MVLPYKHPWKALTLGVLLGTLTLAGCYLVGLADPLQAATLYTGRISAILFLPVFVARPLADLFGIDRVGVLVRHRSGLGVALAGNHHVHMILLTVLLVGQGATLVDFLLNPGLYIYGLIILMNITSFPKLARKLPKNAVRWLHLVGIYALAAAFFETLILSVLTGQESGLFRIGYMILFIVSLFIRITGGWRQKQQA